MSKNQTRQIVVSQDPSTRYHEYLTRISGGLINEDADRVMVGAKRHPGYKQLVKFIGLLKADDHNDKEIAGALSTLVEKVFKDPEFAKKFEKSGEGTRDGEESSSPSEASGGEPEIEEGREYRIPIKIGWKRVQGKIAQEVFSGDQQKAADVLEFFKKSLSSLSDKYGTDKPKVFESHVGRSTVSKKILAEAGQEGAEISKISSEDLRKFWEKELGLIRGALQKDFSNEAEKLIKILVETLNEVLAGAVISHDDEGKGKDQSPEAEASPEEAPEATSNPDTDVTSGVEAAKKEIVELLSRYESSQSDEELGRVADAIIAFYKDGKILEGSQRSRHSLLSLLEGSYLSEAIDPRLAKKFWTKLGVKFPWVGEIIDSENFKKELGKIRKKYNIDSSGTTPTTSPTEPEATPKSGTSSTDGDTSEKKSDETTGSSGDKRIISPADKQELINAAKEDLGDDAEAFVDATLAYLKDQGMLSITESLLRIPLHKIPLTFLLSENTSGADEQAKLLAAIFNKGGKDREKLFGALEKLMKSLGAENKFQDLKARMEPHQSNPNYNGAKDGSSTGSTSPGSGKTFADLSEDVVMALYNGLPQKSREGFLKAFKEDFMGELRKIPVLNDESQKQKIITLAKEKLNVAEGDATRIAVHFLKKGWDLLSTR